MNDTWQGIVLWSLMFFPVWWPGCRRARRRMNVSRNLQHETEVIAVSNATLIADATDADLATWGVGPDWVQDKPYPELFEED